MFYSFRGNLPLFFFQLNHRLVLLHKHNIVKQNRSNNQRISELNPTYTILNHELFIHVFFCSLKLNNVKSRPRIVLLHKQNIKIRFK